jgi:hypothetical protein
MMFTMENEQFVAGPVSNQTVSSYHCANLLQQSSRLETRAMYKRWSADESKETVVEARGKLS